MKRIARSTALGLVQAAGSITIPRVIYLGTSGFSYTEWQGSFYPEKLPQKQFLSYYSTKFNTTEINSTFYRFPSRNLVEGWAKQVADEFRFALKLSQRITHRKKLTEVDEEMGWFLNGAEPLGPRLGCVLVQLPPWFKQDLPLLDDFLDRHGKRAPFAFEFRHDTWRTPETYRLLSRHEAAWAVVETDDKPAVREITAPFTYIRLRKSSYAPQEISEWSRWIGCQSGDCYAYLKHQGEAPRWARELRDSFPSHL